MVTIIENMKYRILKLVSEGQVLQGCYQLSGFRVSGCRARCVVAGFLGLGFGFRTRAVEDRTASKRMRTDLLTPLHRCEPPRARNSKIPGEAARRWQASEPWKLDELRDLAFGFGVWSGTETP